MEEEKLTVCVATPDEPVWQGSAYMVVANTQQGEMGILADHQPVLASLAPGKLRIKTNDGIKRYQVAGSGILSVYKNLIEINTLYIEPLEDE